MIHSSNFFLSGLRALLPVILLHCFSVAIATPPADLTLLHIADIAGSPIAVRHAGDGSGRIFIVSRNGTIRIQDGNQVLSTLFLDITKRVSSGGETGMLGLAFHPGYSGNGYFFVNYTNKRDSKLYTRVSRFQVSQNPQVADPSSELIVLEVQQPYSNHNGGDIHFGSDGYLYIGMGDGGSGGDPGDRARNNNNLMGKMLRIDVDSSDPGTGDICAPVANYGIPASNPYQGANAACDEIWAYGLRNPWRWSFDRQTHDMLIADVGQRDWEEVDFQPANSTGGEYYGWSCMEGNHEFNASRCDTKPHVGPILEYPHQDGNCSITGGYIYRGPIPGMNGIYIYADYCTGIIWFAEYNGAWSVTKWQDTDLNISGFGEDEAGNVYVVGLGGGIYRFKSNDCSLDDEHVTGTVASGKTIYCVAPDSIIVEDFLLQGSATLSAPVVRFLTDEQSQIMLETGAVLRILP